MSIQTNHAFASVAVHFDKGQLHVLLLQNTESGNQIFIIYLQNRSVEPVIIIIISIHT